MPLHSSPHQVTCLSLLISRLRRLRRRQGLLRGCRQRLESPAGTGTRAAAARSRSRSSSRHCSRNILRQKQPLPLLPPPPQETPPRHSRQRLESSAGTGSPAAAASGRRRPCAHPRIPRPPEVLPELKAISYSNEMLKPCKAANIVDTISD